MSVRPNQIIAAALEFSPLTNPMKKAVIDVVKNELLTPKGLRSHCKAKRSDFKID